MARVLTDNKYYSQIADVIREQNGTNNTYTPPQMVNALKDLFYEEVEGVPPISFNGIGENLLDYRIDGASGGVGDLITDISDDNYGKYKVPVVVSGKNLFDGIYGANHFSKIEPDKTITISTKSTGESSITFVYKKSDGTRFKYTRLLNENETSGSVTVTTPSEAVGIGIYAAKDYTSQTMIYDTLIEYRDRATTYEPYHEPITTNIYLDSPIEAKANIPNEYTEVEYIESTGTQYIDTNYTPVQGDDLEFKNVTINNFNGALFSAGIESYQLILLGLGSVCYYKYFQVGNAVASSFSTITNGNIKVLNGNLYINNVLKAEADYGGAVNTTLNIFQRANNTSNLICKIGEIIISNNGIIKRDFIPCYRKSDNVAGLYDLVNNTFYTNQGTGNFIVGPIKENESISLSDTNTNIPTIRGTNVLTVDTTVQPSNVYVKSRHESSYETAMRERYEEAQAQLDALESE